MNKDKIQGVRNVPDDGGQDESHEIVERKIQPIKEMKVPNTQKRIISVNDVEAMINAKARSISKPRSG